MQTILRSEKRELKIDTDGQVAIIGESINPTGRKKLAAALQDRDFSHIGELAVRQAAAGADILDVNVGVLGCDEVTLIPEVVKLVASHVDLPICVDSSDTAALAAGLDAAPGKPLANSVTGEEKSLAAVLPVVKDRGAAVIGLLMDETGIPKTSSGRLEIAKRMVERATRIGIPLEDIVIDPLVMTVGADSAAGDVTLQTIDLVRREIGVNIAMGASNVSFGLPERSTINQAFLALAVYSGATCIITDPVKISLTLRAVDLLRGRDNYAACFIALARSRMKQVNAQA